MRLTKWIGKSSNIYCLLHEDKHICVQMLWNGIKYELLSAFYMDDNKCAYEKFPYQRTRTFLLDVEEKLQGVNYGLK